MYRMTQGTLIRPLIPIHHLSKFGVWFTPVVSNASSILPNPRGLHLDLYLTVCNHLVRLRLVESLLVEHLLIEHLLIERLLIERLLIEHLLTNYPGSHRQLATYLVAEIHPDQILPVHPVQPLPDYLGRLIDYPSPGPHSARYLVAEVHLEHFLLVLQNHDVDRLNIALAALPSTVRASDHAQAVDRWVLAALQVPGSEHPEARQSTRRSSVRRFVESRCGRIRFLMGHLLLWRASTLPSAPGSCS